MEPTRRYNLFSGEPMRSEPIPNRGDLTEEHQEVSMAYIRELANAYQRLTSWFRAPGPLDNHMGESESGSGDS